MIDIRTGKQMTRGGFLRGILASGIAPSITLATIANAVSANANVSGMMRNVGARQAAMFGEKYFTAKDYISNGLISIYDAIENDGYDIPHKQSPSYWKDLKGVVNLTQYGSVEWGGDYVRFSDSQFYSELRTFQMIELCVEDEKRNGLYFLYGNYDKMFVFNFTENYSSIYLSGSTFQIPSAKSTLSADYANDHLYINGEMKSSIGQTTKTYMKQGLFCVGERGNGFRNFFIGKIHCVRMYSRALSSAEVLHNYMVDSKRFGV